MCIFSCRCYLSGAQRTHEHCTGWERHQWQRPRVRTSGKVYIGSGSQRSVYVYVSAQWPTTHYVNYVHGSYSSVRQILEHMDFRKLWLQWLCRFLALCVKTPKDHKYIDTQSLCLYSWSDHSGSQILKQCSSQAFKLFLILHPSILCLIYLGSTKSLGASLAEVVQHLLSKCEALISSHNIHHKDMYKYGLFSK
jgi:hypothetical protein